VPVAECRSARTADQQYLVQGQDKPVLKQDIECCSKNDLLVNLDQLYYHYGTGS
jgi:hypothetical protein